ncbi:hypothetical protein BX667DRAFT_223858 [Coemansia mojavensis]|nr:hypothetical protein BX667DRAFT_223858 [Coemansia mojavensis]
MKARPIQILLAVIYFILAIAYAIMGAGQITRRKARDTILNGSKEQSEPNRLYDAAGDFGNFSNTMAAIGNFISAAGMVFWVFVLCCKKFRKHIFHPDKDDKTSVYCLEFMFAGTNIAFIVSDPLFIDYYPSFATLDPYQVALPFMSAMLALTAIIMIYYLSLIIRRCVGKNNG